MARTPKPVRSEDRESQAQRRHQIMEVSAQLFARHGYNGTSMRDIAEGVGILRGSLYHHIRSKEELFIEIHDQALDTAGRRIIAAMAARSDPWDRMEAACAELLEIQLNPTSITLPIMNNFLSVPDSVKAALVRKRDDFENIFRDIVNDLPLPETIDRGIYRILLLQLLNTADNWYREGRLSRREIAEQIFAIFRHDVT